MSGSDIHQLAAAYALDAVDDRERAEFEAHYSSCPVCRPEVAGYRETLSHVAAASAVPPRESLKAEVMAEIGVTRQLSPLPGTVVELASFRRRHQTATMMLAAAALVLIVGAGAFIVGRRSTTTSGYAAAAADVFGRADTQFRQLSGSGAGTVTVAWSPSAAKAVVAGAQLPDPGADEAYELWLIDASGAHAMRLLDRAVDGRVQRVIDVEGTPMQWAVTVEPDTGVDQPSGEIIFSGAA